MQLSGDGMILALLNETNCLNMYGLKIEERVIANCDYMDATSIALSGSGHRVAIAQANDVKPLVILRCNNDKPPDSSCVLTPATFEAAFNPQFGANGAIISIQNEYNANSENVKVYNSTTGLRIGRKDIISSSSDLYQTFGMSKNGKSIAVRTDDESTTVYDYGPASCPKFKWCPKNPIPQEINIKSVSLSQNGLKMAVSVWDMGVEYFGRSSIAGDWKELKPINVKLKSSSSLSANGDIIAINNGTKTIVYKHDGTNHIWNQYGTPIPNGCLSGVDNRIFLSLSANGKRLAISGLCCTNDCQKMQVYENLNGKMWNYFGDSIVDTEMIGRIQLSGNGNILALQNLNDSCVDIYQNEKANWLKEKRICNYKNEEGIALSQSGERIAIAQADFLNAEPLVMLHCNCTKDVRADPECLEITKFGADGSGMDPQLSGDGQTVLIWQLKWDKIYNLEYDIKIYNSSTGVEIGQAMRLGGDLAFEMFIGCNCASTIVKEATIISRDIQWRFGSPAN